MIITGISTSNKLSFKTHHTHINFIFTDLEVRLDILVVNYIIFTAQSIFQLQLYVCIVDIQSVPMKVLQ